MEIVVRCRVQSETRPVYLVLSDDVGVGIDWDDVIGMDALGGSGPGENGHRATGQWVNRGRVRHCRCW